ncbi:MAG: diguanylate cyclase (GGDEF)-like protein [Oleiphilaceae bacterium]|jgi:diguanylate cyclase (GGDEF)-like protein
MALIVSMAVYWANITIAKSSDRALFGHEIIAVVSELEAGLRGILSFNRVTEHAKWNGAHTQLNQKLFNYPLFTSEQKMLIRNIQASSKSLTVLFSYLKDIEPGTTKKNQELRRYIAERLYVQMDVIVENSQRLTLIAQDDINKTINRVSIGIVGLLLILGAVMTVFALHLGHYISESITTLMLAMKHVAAGKLDTHVDSKGRDEISRLASGFNEMTRQLMVATDTQYLLQQDADKRAKELKYLAHHDALTKLPNRLLFDVLLGRSLKHAQRHEQGVAVVFMDLDKFKNINDSLGHPAGDELLKILARRLTKSLRKIDTVTRIGGDEFVLLIEEINHIKDAEIAIKKVIAVFDESFLLKGHEIMMTASIGISLYPMDGEESSILIKNADAAMYLAKNEGRNSFKFYNHTLTKNAYDQVFLETALRGALSRKEFYLVYQPQVSIEDGDVLGMEVLLRWNHVELGLISPEVFIPIAEANGLIHDIGAWVLLEACRQGKNWIDAGLNFGRIAVNISGLQVMKSGFCQEVADVLSSTQLLAKNLELEVTEGSIMQNTERAIQHLKALRSMGILLAVDDFGTGYSSLSYLKRLPIDRLKIDRSFIIDIPEDEDAMVIAEAVIALGGALNLVVVAEGIENEEQLQFLKARACPVAQGFLFSKPITVEAMTQYLQKENSQK